MLRIIVTTTPTTAKDTPASKIVTVASSISPKKGNSTILKVWFRNGLLIKTEIKPVVTTMNAPSAATSRSEEHTSELQSRGQLVCRLLLEKKKGALTRNPE